MLPRNHPDGIQITFDDHRLVANAGLLLPATLARHLGQRELVGHHPELGGAPGRTNHRRQDDDPGRRNSDELRIGGTVGTLGGTVKAPSTLDTLQHSFQWSHVRQLDRLSRELLARAWQAGDRPGDGSLSTYLDSSICETFGPTKYGASHHGLPHT